MTETVLFVGDVTPDLAERAKQFDSTAILLDSNNYPRAKNYKVAYTSLGDLPDDNVLWQLLQQFEKIVYVQPSHWQVQLTPNNVFDNIQTLTEYLLFKINKERHNVSGIDDKQYCKNNYTTLADTRKTNNQQLWFAGCSFTVGKGVKPEENYGTLIKNHYNLPASFLASVGSSITWAADQILRSDIRAGDVVVWGLTEHQRFAQWSTHNQVEHLNSSSIDRVHDEDFDVPKNVLLRNITSDTLLYQAVIHVHQVVNYCNKVGAKLFIVGFLSNSELEFALHNVNEFVQYSHRTEHLTKHNWEDLGNDQVHPGPKQHQLFAKFCIDMIDRRELLNK